MPAHENLSDQFKPVYQSEHGSLRVSPEGYVSNLWLRPESRGFNVRAIKLGREVTNDADRLGKRLTTHAREELHPVYKRFGFQVTGEDVIGPRLEREPRRAG